MKLPINEIICGEAEKVMKKWLDSKYIIITDPPYPDYHTKKYQYIKGMLDFLKRIDCKQIIFWSAKVEFPLDYTAIHIWDKKIDCCSFYERIFERNGQKSYKIFRCHPPVYTEKVVRGLRDINLGHKSQKPLRLMKELILDFSKPDDIIVDPFMGTGTTCVAAKILGRNYIGIEMSKNWCKKSQRRLEGVKLGFDLFNKRSKKRNPKLLK